MRLVIALFLLAVLHGCMPNVSLTASAAADVNVSNLSRLNVGMNQKEVLRIMRHPYSDQTFEMDGVTYDVWFYITDIVCLGQSRMVPANLTPLTFKDGELIGWGYAYYNYLKNRRIEGEHPKTYKPAAPQKNEPPSEDIEFEKTLQPLTPSNQIQQTPKGGKTQPMRQGQQSPEMPRGNPPKPTPQSQPKGGKSPVKAPSEQPENLSPLERQAPHGGQGQSTPGEGQSPQTPPSGGQAQPVQQSQPKGGKPPVKPPAEQPENLSPLERQAPQQPTNGASSAESSSSSFSMSSKQKTQKEENIPDTKEDEEKKAPLNEEDEGMLQDASQQQFDQT